MSRGAIGAQLACQQSARGFSNACSPVYCVVAHISMKRGWAYCSRSEAGFWEVTPPWCRVARPHCWGRALQEPDLKLSLHPARALDNAPIKNEDAASFQI